MNSISHSTQTGGVRIRAVVVDHNGAQMTASCVASLLAMKPANVELEIVVVDNGSARSVAASMARDPAVEVRRSATNLGFAGGVNLGLTDLDGLDYVALVNNDVEVDEGWLEPLIDRLAADPSLAAASPKMLFAGRLHELELTTATHVPGRGDHRRLGVRVHEVQLPDEARTGTQLVEGFFGPEAGDTTTGWFQWTGARALIRIPTEGVSSSGRCAIRLSAEPPTSVTIRSGTAVTTLDVGRSPEYYEVAVDGDAYDVVNNVGTVVFPDGYAADRGFMERDAGQYDQPSEIEAWCGGAVLLRADFFRDVGLFDDRLFLYYEDVELSLRGARSGWRYQFEPRSSVRHRHGATAVHGSSRTETFKERNRLLVLARYGSAWTTARAAMRFLLVTLSYARRDIAVPLLRARRPHLDLVRGRLAAFAGFVRRLPAMRTPPTPAPTRGRGGR